MDSGQLLNTVVQIFLPVVVHAAAFLLVMFAVLYVLDAFDGVITNLKERR